MSSVSAYAPSPESPNGPPGGINKNIQKTTLGTQHKITIAAIVGTVARVARVVAVILCPVLLFIIENQKTNALNAAKADKILGKEFQRKININQLNTENDKRVQTEKSLTKDLLEGLYSGHKVNIRGKEQLELENRSRKDEETLKKVTNQVSTAFSWIKDKEERLKVLKYSGRTISYFLLLEALNHFFSQESNLTAQESGKGERSLEVIENSDQSISIKTTLMAAIFDRGGTKHPGEYKVTCEHNMKSGEITVTLIGSGKTVVSPSLFPSQKQPFEIGN